MTKAFGLRLRNATRKMGVEPGVDVDWRSRTQRLLLPYNFHVDPDTVYPMISQYNMYILR